MIDVILQLPNAITIRLSKELKSHKINSVETVVATIHKRIHSNLLSIRNLLTDEKNLSPISASIIFRAVALDYMILLYLNYRRKELEGDSYKWKGESSEKYKQVIDTLLKDQLIRYYKDVYKLIGIEFKNEKEYGDWFTKESLAVPKEFRDITKDSKGYKFLSPSELIDFLKANLPSDEFNSHLKGIWVYYLHYSKIDHFGLISIILENKTMNHFLKEIRRVLLYFHDAFSIIGVDFMQVEAFAEMWNSASEQLTQMEEPE